MILDYPVPSAVADDPDLIEVTEPYNTARGYAVRDGESCATLYVERAEPADRTPGVGSPLRFYVEDPEAVCNALVFSEESDAAFAVAFLKVYDSRHRSLDPRHRPRRR